MQIGHGPDHAFDGVFFGREEREGRTGGAEAGGSALEVDEHGFFEDPVVGEAGHGGGERGFSGCGLGVGCAEGDG